jgi:lipopolysaccharide/colanic/teichoic acid biosynthesis glycosyltransferase
MFYKLIKRIEDILFAVTLIIIFLPIIVFTIIILIIFQGFPVFYISKRVVHGNKLIRVIKFRSMVKDAKSEKYNLEKKYMQNGYLDIPLNSEVYTVIGRILEKTQIVEIPQIISVLVGKLSFIGNRPLPLKNVEILKKEFPKNWYKRFDSPAGMTGITQIVGKFRLSAEQRLELEALYSQVYNKGNVLKADTYIFFSTIILLILRDSVAYRSYDNAKAILISCLNKK